MNYKGFVYFFKHTLVDGVKIGFTKNNTVKSRFDHFKIYSPHGAEILGIIKTSNPKQLESELHKKYSNARMNGEFFNITRDEVQIIMKEHDQNIEIHNIFNEWICNDKNDIESLKDLLKKANSIIIPNTEIIPLIQNYIKVGLTPITLNEIYNFIQLAEHPNEINKHALRKELLVLYGKPKNCVENYKKGRYYYLSSDIIKL